MQNLIDVIRKYFSIQNKFWASSVITFVVLGTLFFLFNNFSTFFISLNLNFQNELFSAKYSNNKIANPIITVIEIDNKTLRDPDKGGLGRWQDFRRSYYAQVIDNLKKSGAKAIGMDILFSEKLACIINASDDEILAKSIKHAGNVVLAFQKYQEIYPLDIFKNVAYKIGDIFPIVNKYNTLVYSIYPFYLDKKDIYESFSFSILRTFYKTENTDKLFQEIKIGERSFKFLDLIIPFSQTNYSNSKSEFLINYIPKDISFTKLSFVDVYEGNYDENLVNNKIVLIGSSATGLHDEYNTPTKGNMPGVYIHANTLNTLLNKKFIRYFSFGVEILVLIIFTYLITILGVYDKHKYYFILSLFIVSIIYFYLYIYCFNNFYVVFSFPIFFFGATILSFLFVNVYRYIYEDKGKRLLQNALGQYLAKDIVNEILKNYDKIKLKGELKENTIFFSDIEGFTTISEKMGPDKLVRLLNLYLEEVSEIIINNKGYINKYEGDGVIVLWGAFLEQSDQAYLACKAALEQQKAINELNKKLIKEFGTSIFVRMGINKGNVIVGNIGSINRKIEYTALGDNVNLASRLEGVNKYYKTAICVSEAVKNGLEKKFVFRFLDVIKVKGKQNAIKIFELIGTQEEISQDIKDSIKEFEKALELYTKEKFKEALIIFEKLKNNGDKPSLIFYTRCLDLISNPPSKDWDGIWEHKDK